MPTPPYIPIPYLNTSGEAVPPFGVLQLTMDVDTAANTAIWSVKTKKPSGVDGVFAIDSGKGAAASGSAESYGTCYIPASHAMWVKFSGSAPATAWETQVGPKAGQWYMTTEGSGYWYAGAYSEEDGLVLVMQVGASTGSGSTGGSSGCCCGCGCISTTNIDDCAACSPDGAPEQIRVDVGDFSDPAFDGLGGVRTLTYDANCIWKDDGDSGYHWEFHHDGLNSKLYLVHDSGGDDLDLEGRPLEYVPDETEEFWNCVCTMKMRAKSRTFPIQASTLNCNVCIVPVGDEECGCYKLTVSGVSGWVQIPEADMTPGPACPDPGYGELGIEGRGLGPDAYNGDFIMRSYYTGSYPSACVYASDSVPGCTGPDGHTQTTLGTSGFRYMTGWNAGIFTLYVAGGPTYEAASGVGPVQETIKLTKAVDGAYGGTWPEEVAMRRVPCLSKLCECFSIEADGYDPVVTDGDRTAGSPNLTVNTVAYDAGSTVVPNGTSFSLIWSVNLVWTSDYPDVAYIVLLYSNMAATVSGQVTYYCYDFQCGGEFTKLESQSTGTDPDLTSGNPLYYEDGTGFANSREVITPDAFSVTSIACETTTTTTSTTTTTTSTTTESSSTSTTTTTTTESSSSSSSSSTSTTTTDSSSSSSSTTSTTSTTTGGCVSMGCTWLWDGANWVNTDNECVVPCAACVTPPEFSGSYMGQTATTDCEISI